MCWNSSICENTKLLDCSIRSVFRQASCLLIKPSQWVFILKTALQGPPPHQQLQAVLRPHNTHNKKHRCLRKSDKVVRKEGREDSREERTGDRSPEKHRWGLNNLIWAPFHVFILKSPRFREESCASSWDVICQANIFKFLDPDSPGCLAEKQFELLSSN